ncbi:MAG: CorA family divalent cation transporter [Chloroflexota bacterium]
MAEVETNGTIAKIETNIAEATQKRWFYVARSPAGIVSKGNAESPSSFSEILGSAGIAWVDYVAQDADFDKEAVTAATQLGFSEQLISSFAGETYLHYQDFDNEIWMRLPSIQVRQLVVKAYPFLLLLRNKLILSVHPLNVDRRFIRLRRYAEAILKKIPINVESVDKLTMLLTRIIDENNDRNFEHLRRIEERGDELNRSMTDPNTQRAKLGPEIYQMKHALIVYLDALWDSVDVLHTLRYGDAELITDDQKLLDKLGILAEDVNRQIGLAEHMSEVLASGLEVLQSLYNNQLQNLNNRLALLLTYLTIIGTAVLVPNTLATMLGNTVFDIGPGDLGWYLALMIGSTIVATGLVYWWVKKRGWIPKKMD